MKETLSLDKHPKTIGKDLVILSLVLSLFFGIFLGTRPLSVPDEGRYTEIPREMVESGRLVVPYVRTVDNLADFFTKQLPASVFFAMRDKIMNIKEDSPPPK